MQGIKVPKTVDKRITKDTAKKVLWSQAILLWKLDTTQQELYKSYLDCKDKRIVWNCSRRLGKSYTLCVIAVETCLKKPNSIVKYVAPTQRQVRTIITPLLRDILQDCPKELRPKPNKTDGVWEFPNGSEIQIAGTDNGNAEGLRGGGATLCIVDEAGFCDDLEYVVQSILLPTTITTKGKIILASTPPKSVDHDFYKYIQDAKFKGNLVTKTIYDCPRLTEQDIQEIIDSYPLGKDDLGFKRECLGELLIDPERVVVPEFTNPTLRKAIVREWPRPPFFDTYVSMDLGVKDLTVVLFAYYDFKHGKLIIEDEFVTNGQKYNTSKLAEGIKQKEAQLWTDNYTGEIKKPLIRITDNDLKVINDLNQLHQLDFIPTKKDNKDAALNNMRVKLGSEKIIINPRCVTLIKHLESGTWNKSKKSYDRSPDDGHYDAIDSCVYLVRNVDWYKNPYPPHYDLNLSSKDAFYVKNEHAQMWKQVFNIRNK